jgi:general secretion pathway protein G
MHIAANGTRRGRSHEHGFTLVELLVVIGILGLLTAIATPQVIRYLASAKISTARTEVKSLASALDLFKLDVGRYPTTQEGLPALLTAPAGAETWSGPYIDKGASLIDPWGHPFNYQSPGQHGEFDIFSYGPDANATSETPKIASW